MTNEHYHCLDINYKTEMELKAVSTYLFVFIVLSSFFYFQLNHFMTQEIRHLNRELYFIRQKITNGEEEGSDSSGSSGSSGSSSSGSSGSNDSSSSSEEEEEEPEPEPETEREIRFRGRRYTMKQ